MRRGRLSKLLPWALLPVAAVLLTLLELHLKRHVPPSVPPGPEVVWVFKAPRAGAVISSPLVGGGRVYAGTIRDRPFKPAGIVYALDTENGKIVWKYDAGGEMVQMFSSPCLVDGLLYIGEGMHANLSSSLHCIDADTGKGRWRFATTGHIESSPCVAEGRVFFGAGDDGVYALDARSGKKLWQYDEKVHVDSSPTVANGLVYAGSGVSRRYAKSSVFALDAATGKPKWRTPVDLPAWGSPVVDSGKVYVGLGNGRLDQSDPAPAGALVCLNAYTGSILWTRPLADSVMGRVALHPYLVWLGCRDGGVYALNRADGQIIFRYDAGSPVVTTPVLSSDSGRLFVVASRGRIACLNADSGREIAAIDLAEHLHTDCRLYSSPAIREDSDGHFRVWFGAELKLTTCSEADVICLRF